MRSRGAPTITGGDQQGRPHMLGPTHRAAGAAAIAVLATGAMSMTTSSALAVTPKPAVKVTLVGAKLRATTSATFRISRTPMTAKLSCRLDRGAWAPCTAVRTVSHLRNGKHTLAVRATAGRIVASASAPVWVDTQAPHAPTIGNQSGGWTNAPSRAVFATAVTDVGVAG